MLAIISVQRNLKNWRASEPALELGLAGERKSDWGGEAREPQAEVLSDGEQMVEAGGQDTVEGPWRFQFPCPEARRGTLPWGESGSEQNPAFVLRAVLGCRGRAARRLVLVSVPAVSDCVSWTHGCPSLIQGRKKSGE